MKAIPTEVHRSSGIHVALVIARLQGATYASDPINKNSFAVFALQMSEREQNPRTLLNYLARYIEHGHPTGPGG